MRDSTSLTYAGKEDHLGQGLGSLEAASPLSVRDLAVAYHKKPVLSGVSFDIPEGQLIGILGPNGAGKSTLIKAVLGLIPKMNGEVRIFGQSYREQRRRIGYVPQRESVDWDFPTHALDVVMMGRYGHLGWFRRPGKKERDLAAHCLEQVGMGDFMHRQISQLSGGSSREYFWLAPWCRTLTCTSWMSRLPAWTPRPRKRLFHCWSS